VLGEDGSAEGVDFAEGDGADADTFAGEGEAADAGKQVERGESDIHFAAFVSSFSSTRRAMLCG
jgi:hypothetical protein